MSVIHPVDNAVRTCGATGRPAGGTKGVNTYNPSSSVWVFFGGWLVGNTCFMCVRMEDGQRGGEGLSFGNFLFVLTGKTFGKECMKIMEVTSPNSCDARNAMVGTIRNGIFARIFCLCCVRRGVALVGERVIQ